MHSPVSGSHAEYSGSFRIRSIVSGVLDQPDIMSLKHGTPVEGITCFSATLCVCICTLLYDVWSTKLTPGFSLSMWLARFDIIARIPDFGRCSDGMGSVA